VDVYGNIVDAPHETSPTLMLQWEVDDNQEQETQEMAMDIENMTEHCQFIQLQRLTRLTGGMRSGRVCTFVPIPESMITLASREEFPRNLQIKAYDANNSYEAFELSCTVVAGGAESILIRENGNDSEYCSVCHVDVTQSSKLKFELKLLDILQLSASLKSMKKIVCTITIENGTQAHPQKTIKKEADLQNFEIDFKKIHASHPHLFDTQKSTEFKLTCHIIYDGECGEVRSKPCHIICRVMAVNCVSAISVIRLSENGDETQKNNIRCGDAIKCVVKLSTQDKVRYIMSLDEAKKSIRVNVAYNGVDSEMQNIHVTVNHRDGSLIYNLKSLTTPGKYKFHFFYTEIRASIIKDMHPSTPPQVRIHT
jgi:hypothetical protein